MLHGRNLEEFQKENKSSIDDNIRYVAAEFHVSPEELLGYVLEFGAKLDRSLDNEGYGRIEKISFEAYNESTCLIEVIERFRERTGYYPERVLANQI